MKYIVLLGAQEGEGAASVQRRHKDRIPVLLLENPQIEQYATNFVVEPSKELIEAGWGWGGVDDTGVIIFDEIWTRDEFNVASLFEGERLIGIYDVDEIILRTVPSTWPIGEKSPWIKRIGLLKCFTDQRVEDFHAYWKKNHGELALTHHVGAAIYKQNHITNALVDAPTEWNGIVMLSYWNANAFAWGHFPRPDSFEAVKEDGSHFMELFRAFCAEEYLMKRGDIEPEVIPSKSIIL